MGYSFRLAARVILYASTHRQDDTYHSLCYTSCGALAGTRNSSMGPPWRIDPTTHRTMSERSYHRATSRSQEIWSVLNIKHTPFPVCVKNKIFTKITIFLLWPLCSPISPVGRIFQVMEVFWLEADSPVPGKDTCSRPLPTSTPLLGPQTGRTYRHYCGLNCNHWSEMKDLSEMEKRKKG